MEETGRARSACSSLSLLKLTLISPSRGEPAAVPTPTKPAATAADAAARKPGAVEMEATATAAPAASAVAGTTSAAKWLTCPTVPSQACMGTVAANRVAT